MSNDRKVGALILVVAVTLIAVTLVLSEGWGRPGVSLYLSYLFLYGGGGPLDDYYGAGRIPSRYVLVPLVMVAGYGVIRFFSLIPPIFRRQIKSQDKVE
jgi:hypothetical protein